MTKLGTLTGIAVAACLSWVAPAHADVISDWNAATVLYVSAGDPSAVPPIPVGRGGPAGSLDIALVHVAIHDAVQAIEGRYQPYYYSDPTKFGIGSPEAAAAAAAHRVLVLLYPSQQGRLDDYYDDYLLDNGLADDPGLEVGEAAAVALYTSHYRPVISLPPFFGGINPGEWRSAVPMAFLYLGVSTPFTLNRISQFRPPPPPPMQSAAYFREYEEVRTLGRDTAHPNMQTDLARFWSGNFFAQWNEALRQIANAKPSDVGDSARLFALASLTVADTVMAVFESKRFYNFWRPSTAIQKGDDDPNANTAGDVTWAPWLADPPYPDYVSGANGVTAAFTGLLRLYFGTDNMDFSVKSIPLQAGNEERFYSSFSQAEEEVVDARILLGIHFRSADEEARRLGNRVAHWVIQQFLRPVPGS
jgi:hypothetical protein